MAKHEPNTEPKRSLRMHVTEERAIVEIPPGFWAWLRGKRKQWLILEDWNGDSWLVTAIVDEIPDLPAARVVR